MVRHPARAEGLFLDETDGFLRSVVPHADNNVYVAIPHPAADTVMAANKDRLFEVLRTTFFGNAAALECQLAAICLTLRGVTIVRAFIAVGRGGVGQSRSTCLIANVLGHMHGFMDVTVFYTENKVWKQADTFISKVARLGTPGLPTRH